jgi:hypothetical protein
MKQLNIKKSTAGLFSAVASLFIIYLLSIRQQVYLPVSIFWVAVVVLIGTLIYQILGIKSSSPFTKLILIEIAVTSFIFCLIFQIPNYGLYGQDPYGDLSFAKDILFNGHIAVTSQYYIDYSNFPILHIFSAIISMITAVDLFSVAKWFPSFLSAGLVFILYLLISRILKDKKIALLSVLVYVCLENHILWGSLFVRETYALVLAVMCIYLYFTSMHSSHPRTYCALSILCLIITVFTHHLTSFLLMLFFLIHLLVTKVINFSFLRKVNFGDYVKGEKVTLTFLLIAVVAILSYWTFIVTYPLETLISFGRDLFETGKYGVGSYAGANSLSASSITTIRGNITFYGFYFFNLIFCIILLFNIMPRRKYRRVETISFTLFLLFCLFMGFVSLYLLPAYAFPDRYLTYGWLFGIPPLISAILITKYKYLRKIGVLLVIAFILFNIYIIPPSLWSPRSQETSLATVEIYAPSLEDYALARALNFSTGTILAPDNDLMAIYDMQNNLGTFYSSFNGNRTNFNWIVVQKEANTTTLTMLSNSTDYNKIYDSNSLSVYGQRQR